MKTIALLYLLLFLAFLGIGQTIEIDRSDTISYNANIQAVSDTLPDIAIFASDAPMKLTLKYDITSFIRQKMKGEYLDAEMHLEYNDYSTTKNIRLKARGNNRREQCFFPPIYLNFKTDPIQFSELKGYRKIKLITHCSSSQTYTKYLLREYLTYKIYNILSDNSFRVKLLDIKYIDTGKKGRNYERYGVLIEPIDLLVIRSNSVEVNGSVIQATNVNAAEADVVALFNYMIGNTDWRFKTGHNMKFMKSLSSISQEVTPIPYDFDFSGFVGTNYSHPQEWTSIDNVKEREYMGYCRKNKADYLKTIQLFIDKKDAIIQTIQEFSYLQEREKRGLMDYVESFYNEIRSPERFIQVLEGQCRPNDF